MMTRFRQFVQEHEVKDLYLHGRRFTWSSEREVPTLTRAITSVDWDLMHPDSILQALSSSVSDHAPIHLSLSAASKPKKRFKFEAFWLNLEGFEAALREAWVCDPSIVDPFRCLDALFRNAAEYFEAWGEKKVGNIKLKIVMSNTLILKFDVAQESRMLTHAEAWLRRTLKHAVLGLSSLERTIARQRSRIRWLQEGDANTKLFHVVANGRRTKNYIASVRVGEETVTTHERKNVVFTEAYDMLIGSIHNREHTINLEALNIPDRPERLGHHVHGGGEIKKRMEKDVNEVTKVAQLGKSKLQKLNKDVLDTLQEIQERHNTVKEIETKLLELLQIYRDLSILVEAQGKRQDNVEEHGT
ncbi:hypothetical protein QYE76_002005 [Lolium multiflorum]|uniref:t-SNARE coiled-coil homology domain-containing protein n=1 Tax=Lolium multiflorum TaxID=4521 RepID=A0AAD8VXH1_LOLMU|nr:hypothetical protein QYE76_002005 [Lolium multiflorum]